MPLEVCIDVPLSQEFVSERFKNENWISETQMSQAARAPVDEDGDKRSVVSMDFGSRIVQDDQDGMNFEKEASAALEKESLSLPPAGQKIARGPSSEKEDDYATLPPSSDEEFEMGAKKKTEADKQPKTVATKMVPENNSSDEEFLSKPKKPRAKPRKRIHTESDTSDFEVQSKKRDQAPLKIAKVDTKEESVMKKQKFNSKQDVKSTQERLKSSAKLLTVISC